MQENELNENKDVIKEDNVFYKNLYLNKHTNLTTLTMNI